MKKLLLTIISWLTLSSVAVTAATSEPDIAANSKVNDTYTLRVDAQPNSPSLTMPAGKIINLRYRDEAQAMTRKVVSTPERSRLAYVAQNATRAEGRFTVRVKVVGGTDVSMALIQDKYVHYLAQKISEDTYECSVPAGKYLLQAVLDMDGHKVYYMPDIEITENRELTIDAADCVYSAIPDALYPDGGKVVLRDSDNKGNTTMYIAYGTFYNGLGVFTNAIYDAGGGEHWQQEYAVTTNLQSEKISCYWCILMEDNHTHDNYILYNSSNFGSLPKDGIIVNNPSNYYLYTANLSRTPAYEKLGKENEDMTFAANFYGCSDKRLKGGWGGYYNAPSRVMVCSSPVMEADVFSDVQLGSLDDYNDSEGITTPPMIKNQEGIEYSAMPQGSYNLNNYPSYPTNELNRAFTYSFPDKPLFGSTNAYCVTYRYIIQSGDLTIDYLQPISYLGNFGELRTIDVSLAQPSVFYNGVEQDLSSYSTIQMWALAWAQTEREPGVMKYVYRDNNISIDGMEGHSLCTTEYDETKEDSYPPTIQRIMIKNKNGEPSIYIDDPENYVVAIAGGDFSTKTTPMNLGYRTVNFECIDFSPATLKAEYAPNGTDDFAPLNSIEIPENLCLPGYGTYYECKLSEVTKESANQWYDLRISMTDSAGNSQTQLISPAFKMNKGTGIAINKINNVDFKVIDGKIVTSDNAEPVIYGIAGERVRNEHLQPGIYIVKNSTRTTKVIVK